MAVPEKFFPGIPVTEHPNMRTLEDGTVQWKQKTVAPPHHPSHEYWSKVDAVRGFFSNAEVDEFQEAGGGIVLPMSLNPERSRDEPFLVAPIFIRDEEQFVRKCLGMDLPIEELEHFELPD